MSSLSFVCATKLRDRIENQYFDGASSILSFKQHAAESNEAQPGCFLPHVIGTNKSRDFSLETIKEAYRWAIVRASAVPLYANMFVPCSAHIFEYIPCAVLRCWSMSFFIEFFFSSLLFL